jgi:hypothetical protein
MNSTIHRRIAASAAAAGIFLGSMALGPITAAVAEPGPTTQCSSMTMPSTTADANVSNSLTRAGQVGAASAPASSGGSAEMMCTPIGHG